MPTKMLCHVPSLGGAEAFQALLSHVEQRVNGVPDLPWDRIVPSNPIGPRFANEAQKLALQAEMPTSAFMDCFAERNAAMLKSENAFL